MADELTDATGQTPPVSLEAWTCRHCGMPNVGAADCAKCGQPHTNLDRMQAFGESLILESIVHADKQE